MSGLPPLASSGVFFVTGSSLINAPVDKVWDILLDFPSYPEWNPFVRSQTVTPPISAPSTLAPSSILHMTVHIPPSLTTPPFPRSLYTVQQARTIVTIVDIDARRISWRSNMFPSWLLVSDRWQALSIVRAPAEAIHGKDGSGPEQHTDSQEQERTEEIFTRYESIEVFHGPLAYVVKWLYRAGLCASFQAMADALKARAERT